MNNVHNTVVVEQQREPIVLGGVAMFLLIGILALIVQFFWQIVIVLGFVLTVFVVWLLWRDQQLRARDIALRADEQNRMVLEGDERGIYGG